MRAHVLTSSSLRTQGTITPSLRNRAEHQPVHFIVRNVLRLHSREWPPRNPLHRGNQFFAEALGAASEWRGSLFVKKYGVYRLVYVEAYDRAEEAIAREKQLKRWKREWKIELIERENLEWRDLSDLLV